MRKFKVKNRRKRKYVKKHDLASSLSFTNTVTLGVLPAILIAIPFIATYLVYNFSLPQVFMPGFTMPEIVFHFTLPAMPQISLPQPAAPELPQINIPDFSKLFFQVYQTITATLGAFGAAVLFGASTFSATTVQATGQLITLLDPRPFLQMTGQAISSSAQQTIIHTEAEWTATGNLMIQLGLFTGNALIALWGATYAGLQWLGNAIVNGWNAFVWFIGTPFRALDSSAKELQQASTPATTFIENAFRIAINEFTSGLHTLTGSNAK